MVLDGVADAIDGMVLDEGGIEDGGIQEKQSPPAQARAGAAMELLALQGSANADAMVLDGVADEIDGMELDEGGIEDGGIQEKESPPGYLSRAIERDWGAIEDGCTWRWMKIMPTAEQKRVLEMDADNAEKGRLARNKLQRVREAAGRMTDGTTLSIGNSDGLDLHKSDSQVNAPAYRGIAGAAAADSSATHVAGAAAAVAGAAAAAGRRNSLRTGAAATAAAAAGAAAARAAGLHWLAVAPPAQVGWEAGMVAVL